MLHQDICCPNPFGACEEYSSLLLQCQVFISMLGMQGGRMSQHMEKMQLGETIDVKGPLGHFIYDGHSQFRNSGKKGTAKKMSMIAGGTGITPMFQIIKVIFLRRLASVARQVRL